MQILLYTQLNVFAFVILLLIFVNTQLKNKTPDRAQKLYNALLICNAVLLFSDSASTLLDGQLFPAALGLHKAVVLLYHSAEPAACYLWCLFVEERIHHDPRRLKRIAPFLALPVLVNLLFSILSLFTDSIFYIDSLNRYHRGSLLEVMVFSCYFYLLYILLYIFIFRKRLSRKLWLLPLVYGIPPYLGGLAQLHFAGFPLTWTSMALSALILFINFQNDQLFEDHLTGLGNRRYLDLFLQNKKSFHDDRHRIAGIMIDVDSFKQINDHFGHNAGDLALDYTGRLLKECLRPTDMIARYGGDEFMILLKIKEDREVHDVVALIRENTARFNEKKLVPFEIKLSIGYDILQPHSKHSVSEFLHHIDHLMYQDKEHNKQS